MNEKIKLNGIEIEIPIQKIDDEIMINVTPISNIYNKRINDWYRLTSNIDYINYIRKILNIKNTIIAYKGKPYRNNDGTIKGGYTLININLLISCINWLSGKEGNKIIKFIINKVINKIINSSPNSINDTTENICKFYNELIKFIDENILIERFKILDEEDIKESCLLKDNYNKYYFYFLTSNNIVIKISKEEILTTLYYETDNIPAHILKYLDTLITNKDFIYLQTKYLIISTISNTYENNSVRGNNQKTYLMKDSNTGLTKIGKAVDPKHRERTLQSEKPTISLFAVCEDNVELELHNKFEDKRVRGEWFNLMENEIEDIVNSYKFIKEN